MINIKKKDEFTDNSEPYNQTALANDAIKTNKGRVYPAIAYDAHIDALQEVMNGPTKETAMNQLNEIGQRLLNAPERKIYWNLLNNTKLTRGEVESEVKMYEKYMTFKIHGELTNFLGEDPYGISYIGDAVEIASRELFGELDPTDIKGTFPKGFSDSLFRYKVQQILADTFKDELPEFYTSLSDKLNALLVIYTTFSVILPLAKTTTDEDELHLPTIMAFYLRDRAENNIQDILPHLQETVDRSSLYSSDIATKMQNNAYRDLKIGQEDLKKLIRSMTYHPGSDLGALFERVKNVLKIHRSHPIIICLYMKALMMDYATPFGLLLDAAKSIGTEMEWHEVVRSAKNLVLFQVEVETLYYFEFGYANDFLASEWRRLNRKKRKMVQ